MPTTTTLEYGPAREALHEAYATAEAVAWRLKSDEEAYRRDAEARGDTEPAATFADRRALDVRRPGGDDRERSQPARP
jgi:hypothetical protein